MANTAFPAIRDSIDAEDRARLAPLGQEGLHGMRIAELLAALPVEECDGADEGEVTSVTYDSGEVSPGACFVAIRGVRADGHAYIGAALARGAALVVGEAPVPPD